MLIIITGNENFLYFQSSKLVNMLANFLLSIIKSCTIDFRIVCSTILHFASLEDSNKHNGLFSTNRLLSYLIFKLSIKYRSKITKFIIHTALIKSYDKYF